MTEPRPYRAFAGADVTRDDVTEEAVLAPVERLGAAASGPEGRPGVALAPGGRIEVQLRQADWRRWDQLVLPVSVSPGDGATLSVALNTGTSTPGLHTPDQFHTWAPVGTSARFGAAGWQEVLLPFENFHIVGMPDGWRRVDRITIAVNANKDQVWLGAMRGQRRRRPPGPRLTRSGLFAELDLDRPDLAGVRQAAEAGDLDGADNSLVAYFRRRSAPRHLFPRPGPAADLKVAEALLRHTILNQALPATIDWRANPNGYLEWRHAFNRHYWMRPLLDACLAARDERYAAELDMLMRTWIEQSPAPVGHTGGGDPAWETLSTAVRIYGIWLDLWFGLADSPSFTPAARLMMLRSIFAHAEHLMQHSVTWHNNWEIVESEAIALVGVMFPEFRRAAQWREEGLRRLWAELDRQVHPDGLQWELSPGYHMMSGQGFVLPFELAQLNGVAVPPEVTGRLEGMFDAILHLTRPDGTLPSLNDSGGVEGSGAEWLRKGSDLYARPDWRWAATGGAEGHPPSAGSHAFDHAGLYVMRSGWGRDDRWLVFDAAPLGRSHQHEDKLSFELYAFGTRFIVDPGISSYMREPWTDYFRSAWAHNTIAVDGLAQNRRRLGSGPQDCRSVAGENLWATGAVLDVVGSTFSGPYGDREGAFVHRRWVLFVRPDYWLVLDEVAYSAEAAASAAKAGAGEGTHLVESLLHFAPMRLRRGAGGELVSTDRLDRPNLDVLALPQSGRWRARIVTGQHEPVQGWITAGDRSIVPAPTAVISRRGGLPIRLGMLVSPYASGVASGIRIERLPAPRGVWAANIHLPDGRVDRLHVAWEKPGLLRGTGLRTDGRFAVLRLDADGKPLAAALVEGSVLALGRRTMIRDERAAALAEWTPARDA